MTHEQKKKVFYATYLSVLTDLVVDYPNVDADESIKNIKDYFKTELCDEDMNWYDEHGGLECSNIYDDVYKHILRMSSYYKKLKAEEFKKKDRILTIQAHYLRVLRDDYLKDKNKLSQYSKAKDIIIEQFEKNKNFGEFVDWALNTNYLYQYPEETDEEIYEELAILLKNRI